MSEDTELLFSIYKRIGKCKIYSSDEQFELARLAKNGDQKAKDKLISSNLRFVITCARKYIGQGVPLVDLIQSGMEGLVLAFDHYDPDRGYKFLSFAIWYIRRELLKAIYNTGRTIRYPITYISKITKIKRSLESFTKENNREPNDEEFLDLTGYTKEQYDLIQLNKSYCQSMDTPVTENSSTAISDTIPYEETPYQDEFTKDGIAQALKCLNPREYLVITKYYGLNGEVNHTIKEIAEELNICDERARQLRKGAIKKLKDKQINLLKTLL